MKPRSLLLWSTALALFGAAWTRAEEPTTAPPPSPSPQPAPLHPPVPKKQVRAKYPSSLLKKGISGVVEVAFTVDPKGNVTDARAVHSSDPALSSAAVAAVK